MTELINQYSFVVRPTIITLIEVYLGLDSDLANDAQYIGFRSVPWRFFAVGAIGYSYLNEWYQGGASLVEPTDMNTSDAVGKLQIAMPRQQSLSPASFQGLFVPSRAEVTIKQWDKPNNTILRTLKLYSSSMTTVQKDGLWINELELRAHSSLRKEAIIGVHSKANSKGMHQ